ncbi:MAG: transposase [Deltaproteobacteria bacterium]|nr:transposase [Deltaproteobacteria bacterium]
MSRPLRIEYPGAVYHITSRGNEKKAIFKDESDREKFLKILAQVNKRYNWLCHAYCLMDNHYHLLIETPDGNLSIGMRQLNGVYTQTFNRRHRRTGHLFQGRFKAILIQKDSHLLEVCRYVVLNPVRARMVEQPGDWKWSSYPATSGRENPHPCLTRDWILGQFSRTRGKAEKGYRQFVNLGIGKQTIWTEVKGQAILGQDEFVNGLIEHIRKRKDIPDIPKSQRYVNRPSLEKIFSNEILQDKVKRDKKVAEAVEKYGYRQREVADYLGMYFTSVSRIMKWNNQMVRK